MRQVFSGFLALCLVAGCADLSVPRWLTPKRAENPPVSEQVSAQTAQTDAAAIPVPAAARTVEDFDTTTAQQRAAAQKTSAAGVDLGLTVVSLGSAAEPGIWLKTPLVSSPGKGRVVFQENGQSVQVQLIPIAGPKTGGSRMSLAALRLINARLTGLHDVRVYQLKP